jgi:hypothetical protein
MLLLPGNISNNGKYKSKGKIDFSSTIVGVFKTKTPKLLFPLMLKMTVWSLKILANWTTCNLPEIFQWQQSQCYTSYISVSICIEQIIILKLSLNYKIL